MAAGNNRALKTLTAILTILLLGLGVYTIKFYNEVKDNEVNLIREKELVSQELEAMLKRYDDQAVEKDIFKSQLQNAKLRIRQLLDSLNTTQASWEMLQDYREQIQLLRDQRNAIAKRLDSVSSKNKELQAERKNYQYAFDKKLKQQDSLIQINTELRERLERGSKLTSSNLNATGIIVRRSGKIVVNDKSSRIDKIQVCYTINENPLGDIGKHNMYLQVIDPNNNVLGSRETVYFGNRNLTYSVYTKLNYFLTKSDQCFNIAPRDNSFEDGLYTINLFEDDRLLETTRMHLR